MSEGIAKLVHMANQIAANLAQEPDPAAATAEHICQFWDPRMKRQLREHGVDGLSPAASAALSLIDMHG